jgi:hypothetical protein
MERINLLCAQVLDERLKRERTLTVQKDIDLTFASPGKIRIKPLKREEC